MLGEYSGFFSNLKKGFELLGHDVMFLHDGDGRKKIPSGNGVLNIRNQSGKVDVKETLTQIKSLRGFDLVILISPRVFSPRVMYQAYHLLRKNNSLLFMTVCGGCSQLRRAVKMGCFDYYMYTRDVGVQEKYCDPVKLINRVTWQAYSHFDYHTYKNCDAIIPVLYEYYLPFCNYSNIGPIIQFPFVCAKSSETASQKTNKKITIYYGLNQPFYKGANYILPALDIIKQKYNNINVIIKDIVPYEEYLDIIKDTDIIIDQCKSYGWAYNAINGLALGKVVLSGARKETLDSFGITSTPIIDIEPDVNQIVTKLSALLDDPDRLEDIKTKGRRFVESFHDPKLVANKYIELTKEIIR